MVILVLFFAYASMYECTSVWPSTPWLQDNSIILSCSFLCIVRADTRRLRSLPKGLRYTTVSFLSHFGIVILPSQTKCGEKTHHIFFVAYVMYLFSHFLFYVFFFSSGNNNNDNDKDDKSSGKNEKMRQHTPPIFYYLGKSNKKYTE